MARHRTRRLPFVGLIALLWVLLGLVGTFRIPSGSMANTFPEGDVLLAERLSFGYSSHNCIPLFGYRLPFRKLLSWGSAQHGDVVIYVHPGGRDEAKADTDEYWMKRVVAVSGDVIALRHDSLYVNGTFVPDPPLASYAERPSDTSWMDEDRYHTFPAGRGFTRAMYGPLHVPGRGDTIPLTSDADWRAWRIFIVREGHTADAEQHTIDGAEASSYTVERDYVFVMGDARYTSIDSRFTGPVPTEALVGRPLFRLPFFRTVQ